jgi:hypothetical protein
MTCQSPEFAVSAEYAVVLNVGYVSAIGIFATFIGPDTSIVDFCSVPFNIESLVFSNGSGLFFRGFFRFVVAGK